MGIYIPGMKMPKNCCKCDLCDGEYGREFYEKAWCRVSKSVHVSPKRRPKNCPLVEVKEPHGRLIDRNAIYASNYIDDIDFYTKEDLDDAPAVIEAEGE